MSTFSGEVTNLLDAFSRGDRKAEKKLFTVVYDELHALAQSAMRNELPGQVLQTTALVHEAFLNLVQGSNVLWRDRSHFFRIAARAMGRILMAEARKRKTIKRGQGQQPISLADFGDPGQNRDHALIPCDYLEEMDKALTKLGRNKKCQRMSSIVDLRFFVGLTIEETAEILGISTATVSRDWNFIKAWLHEEIVRNLPSAG